jgi:hypothetical protein
MIFDVYFKNQTIFQKVFKKTYAFLPVSPQARLPDPFPVANNAKYAYFFQV